VSVQNIKLNTTSAVIFMIFAAEICMCFHTQATFVSFGFSRLCIYGLLNIFISANCRTPNFKCY